MDAFMGSKCWNTPNQEDMRSLYIYTYIIYSKIIYIYIPQQMEVYYKITWASPSLQGFIHFMSRCECWPDGPEGWPNPSGTILQRHQQFMPIAALIIEWCVYNMSMFRKLKYMFILVKLKDIWTHWLGPFLSTERLRQAAQSTGCIGAATSVEHWPWLTLDDHPVNRVDQLVPTLANEISSAFAVVFGLHLVAGCRNLWKFRHRSKQ